MANCMIGFPNNIDSGFLSGGAYLSALPLTLVQQRELQAKARTTNTALASTQFTLDFGQLRNTQGVCIANHNLSIAAKWRVTAYADAGMTSLKYDSSWQDVWPVVYPYGTREWEDPNWWGGRYTQEEMSGYMPTVSLVLSEIVLARWWKIEIDDTTNPSGYVEFARVFIGPMWQPAKNMSWGQSIGWETDTQVQKAQGGAEYFDVKLPYRVTRYKLENIDQDVAMSIVFEIQRRAGVDKELFWVEDPDDAVNAIRTRYLARLRTLGPIEWPYIGQKATAFEIKELQ